MRNYEQFKDNMILRDHLALDRTILANQRTLLAYLRSFIAVLAAGMGLFKFFEQPGVMLAGTIMMCISPLFLVIGLIAFFRERKRLLPIMRVNTPPKDMEKR